MPVAVYARVSTEEQRERQSIETQTNFADRFCKREDLSVFRVYCDDGVSGTIPFEERPAARQVLRDARLGKFDELLVFKVDRIGRETQMNLRAVSDLQKVGVRLRSMTEAFDPSNPN